MPANSRWDLIRVLRVNENVYSHSMIMAQSELERVKESVV